MKFPSLRRTGALLLALALACSLLTLPAAAEEVDDPGFFRTPQTLRLTVGDTQSVNFQVINGTGFILSAEDAEWVNDSDGIIRVSGGTTKTSATVTALSAGTASFALKVTLNNDYEEQGLHAGDWFLVPCEVVVSPQVDDILMDDSMEMTAGETAQIAYRIRPSEAQATIKWSSDNESVATVDLRGRVTANTAGTAVITAEAGGVTKTCTVIVNALAAVTSVKLTDGKLEPGEKISLTISSDETINLTATVEGSADTKTVTWRSTDSAIRVIRTGPNTARVTAVNAAPNTQAAIYAQADADRTKEAFCSITVAEPLPPAVSSVTITSPGSDSFRYVDPGKSMTLEAEALPATATESDRAITWSSSDTSIATVDSSTGKVTGVAPGVAVIYAQAGGDGGPSAFREIEVSGLKLSYLKRSASGGQGTTEELSESSVVPIYQYRDISVSYVAYGDAKNRMINWESSNNTVAQVIIGRVTGNYPGEAVISASAASTNYSASFKVTVSEDVADAIIVDMGSSPSYSFSNIMSQLNNRSQSKAGASLDNVYSLKVSTENGVLYYGYTSPSSPGHGVGGAERYYYQPASNQGQMALRDVSFVPLPGFDGIAVVEYNAVATNNSTFSGTIRIEADSNGDVSYSTALNQPAAFASEHFSAVCKSRTGQAISYVTFSQPAASRGTLYYNYSPTGQFSPKVDSSTRYYASSNPSINNITFVPAEGFAGDVGITYRCTDSSGATYTGTVTVTVNGASGSQASDVEYSTGRNQRLSLSASGFSDACQQTIGGSLDYIRFSDLPGSSAGALYLNYNSSSSTRVSTSTRYYRSSAPRISSITFVPASSYSGTVTIPFTAANTSGTTFSGNLIIHVDDGVGTVHYSTPRSQAVDFDAADFNDASRQTNGAALNYVRFTSLPSSSDGTLYYGYANSSSTGSRVSTGTNYYRSGSPSLSNITFVPASSYSGTVSIPFTAYDDDGASFDGTVTIAVGSGASRTVSYSTVTNGSVRFDRADFNSACRSATGDSLDYVRFDLPASRYGTLYHQYSTSNRTGNSVSSGTSYYYSGGSRLISDVSFAASTATGTVSFGYTGYSTQGDSFSGTVEIQITGPITVNSTIRYTGSSTPVSFRASDFQNICQTALGNSLSYVQFSSLPAVGRLNQNYSGPARTGTGVNSATRYGVQELGQISYLPKAEYQGTITIPFTAYDVQGGSCGGTVEIQLSNAYCSASFSDTASGWDWAKPSIEFLRQSGITTGYSNNTYRPAQSISRGEFTLMICRAFQFPTTGSSGFPDVPASSTYAGAVAAARDLGIVQGNNGLFQPNQPITRQSAMTMICRAMNAAGQAVPTANTSLLSSYVDGGQVSAHARSSVASLIQLGAVRGNSAMRLNPGAAISRAEMAVILHRVLAQ